MHSWKILLADDDNEDLAILQDALESLDAASVLRHARNGEEVIQILEEEYIHIDHPCLIVLDLNMPKLNGTETLRRIKSDDRFKHIPVIIYSTSINPLEREKCLSLGAHSYIAKPVSFKENIEIARHLLQVCDA